MTEAEKAFEFAEKMIEEARESGASSLDFDRDETHALKRLPLSIASLDRLRVLYCDNTQVLDLRPLRQLLGLQDKSTYTFLSFRGCAAAQLDERIAEIAEINDRAERVKSLFEYLKDWTPPEQVSQTESKDLAAPSTPDESIAPLQTDFAQGRLIRIAPSQLPKHDALTRAEMGWEALKAYRGGV